MLLSHSISGGKGGAREPGRIAKKPDAIGIGASRPVGKAGKAGVVGSGHAHDDNACFKSIVEPMDHPTDGELLDHARRFFKAADKMTTV